MRIKKPSETDLQPLLDEATENQSVAQYTETYLKTVAELLKRNPLHYRSYGPYWWLMKKALIDSGIGAFEDPVTDLEMVEATEYPSLEHSLLACWAYSESQHDQMAQNSNTHIMELDDDSLVEYALEDSELEQRGFFGR